MSAPRSETGHDREHPAYGRVLRGLHWIVALLFMATVALILSRYFIDSSAVDKQLVSWHRSIGVSILLLAGIRLLWRLWRRERVEVGMSRLNRIVAAAAHGTLYLLLLATPLIGWLEASARAKKVLLFGLVELPPLIERNSDLAEDLQTWHIWIAYGFLALVALHLAAVAFHFFIRRDGVLYAMLPLPALRPRRLQEENQ